MHMTDAITHNIPTTTINGCYATVQLQLKDGGWYYVGMQKRLPNPGMPSCQLCLKDVWLVSTVMYCMMCIVNRNKGSPYTDIKKIVLHRLKGEKKGTVFVE